MTPASGTQVELEHGDQRVVLASVGAALRRFDVADRPVVMPFDADQVSPVFHGLVLAPWPNRLRDGSYSFAGRDLQVPVSEPARGTALHGLACWEDWAVASASTTSATLALDLPAQPGYPFQLRLEVTYSLGDDGLTVTTLATNVGASALPYGVGFHPWFSPGDGPVDACTLRVDAAARVTVDDRLLPTGTEPVAGDFDFRAPRSLAGIALDDAFVEPLRDTDGRSWATLGSPDGSTTAIWMDTAATAWQVCTGDGVPAPHVRTGVAIEPMSCIADAFRTGDSLVVLEPGQEHELRWGARLIA